MEIGKASTRDLPWDTKIPLSSVFFWRCLIFFFLRCLIFQVSILMTFVIFSTLEIRFLYSDPSESSVWWLCNSQDLAFEETELPSQAGKIKSVWREGFWGTLVPKTCVLWWGA